MATEPATPLDERAELASPRWVEIAASFLADNRTDSYSISKRYTNPPPHLTAAKELGYTATFGPDGATVTATVTPNADWFQTADYNNALPMSWLASSAPDIDRLRNEYSRLFGAKIDAPRERKAMPADVARALDALDDHMAVRTINNPDIRHRAEHLGLGRCLDDLDSEGYTIMPGAFSDDYAAALSEETHRNHAGRNEGASFRATMLLKRGRLWEEAAIHPWVLTVVEYLLGRGCLLYQSDTIVKTTGQETHPGLHADYGASRITEPFPDYCVEGTSVWAIDDFHQEHGPTCILPGSFRNGTQVPSGTTQEGTRLIEMDRGSIAFWHGALWHGSTPRTAPGKRTSLHNAYCRHFIRPLERYDDIDQDIVDRNPPVFSTICGVDDAFGKSGADGADFEKLRYAAEQGYASSKPPVAAVT